MSAEMEEMECSGVLDVPPLCRCDAQWCLLLGEDASYHGEFL